MAVLCQLISSTTRELPTFPFLPMFKNFAGRQEPQPKNPLLTNDTVMDSTCDRNLSNAALPRDPKPSEKRSREKADRLYLTLNNTTGARSTSYRRSTKETTGLWIYTEMINN